VDICHARVTEWICGRQRYLLLTGCTDAYVEIAGVSIYSSERGRPMSTSAARKNLRERRMSTSAELKQKWLLEIV
jgi:hypothetical protein